MLEIYTTEFKSMGEIECFWKTLQIHGDTQLTRMFPLQRLVEGTGRYLFSQNIDLGCCLLLEDVKYWMYMTPKCPKLTLWVVHKSILSCQAEDSAFPASSERLIVLLMET